MSDLSAADVIRLLGLVPHPEGGHYRETFRDESAGGGRAVSTAIYFLLAAGEVSRWHRVDAAELWHWHAGARSKSPSRLRASFLRACASATTLLPASARKPPCRLPIGRARGASAPGRSLAARLRRDSSSPDLSLRQRDSSRCIHCNAKMLQEGRKSDFSTTNQQAAISVTI
jgi:hypothetical protein